ncbi:MAG: YraN family protein [Patescibacteria group bacterium]
MLNPNQRKQLGKIGEEIAAKYLQQKGYKVMARNFSVREGEIDLICAKSGVTVFVEVKTRTNQNFGYPEAAVGKRKIERLILAGQNYFLGQNQASQWQIDVISLFLGGQNQILEIKHFENISIDSYCF